MDNFRERNGIKPSLSNEREKKNWSTTIKIEIEN